MRIEIRKDVIRKFNMVIFVLFCIVSVTMGFMGYRIGIRKETENPFKYESNLDKTDEVDEPDYTIVYWDEMDRSSNGDYVYVFHGHKYQYSERYVEMKMDEGVIGQEYEVK